MDDYTAILSLVFDVINAIIIWMMYAENGERVFTSRCWTENENPIDFRKALDEGRALLAHFDILVHNNMVHMLLKLFSI